MSYLNKSQLKKLIENKPEGTTEQEIVESLIKNGHTFEGIEHVPIGIRMKLEPQKPQEPEKKNLLQRAGEFIGEATGITGTAKAISGAALGGKVADTIAGGVATKSNNLISKAKSLAQDDPRRRQLLEEAMRLAQRGGQAAEGLLGDLPTTEQAVGSMGKLGLTAATAGMGAPASVAGRIGLGGAVGAGFGASNAMEQGKRGGRVVGEALVGGAIGAAIPAGIEAFKWAVKGVPKLLSYTSNTPEEVLQRQYDNPQLSSKMLQEVKQRGALGVTEDINNAAKTLRKNLTQQWQEGSKLLIDSNQGARVGFTSKDVKLLQRIADDYGVDLPQNLSNVSLKESLELNKAINELYNQKAVREGAEGIIVRKTKEMVASKFKSFKGVGEFLKNYGDEKQVLDAITNITKPWSDNPVTRNTALSRIKSVFNDNKPAFLSAVKDLEQSTGIPFLTDKVATLNILQKMPIVSKNLFAQIGELIFSVVTSPRAAGLESRVAGRIGQSGANQPLRNIVSEGVRGTLR